MDQGVFLWFENDIQVEVMVCFLDDVMWGGTESFTKVVEKLKSTFLIGSENHQAFNYVGTHLKQHADYSITLD